MFINSIGNPIIKLLNTAEQFGWITILLHWLSFLAITFLFFEGLYMVELSYYDPLYHTLPYWHKIVGLIVIIFTVARISVILLWKRPRALTQHKLERLAAYGMHTLLYTAILLILISGYIITTGNGEPLKLTDSISLPAITELSEKVLLFMGDAHRWLAYLLALLVIGHTGAALKHHFVNKDATLRRILFPTAPKTQEERE